MNPSMYDTAYHRNVSSTSKTEIENISGVIFGKDIITKLFKSFLEKINID